jgi:hypothetical protein
MDASRAQRSQARISSRCAGVSHQPARRSVRHASAGAARARSGDSGSGAGDSADRLERTFSDKAADASQLADTFLQPLWAPPQQAKVFVFVRHGHSTWNSQSRIQGNTNESELTALGMAQAVRAREALHDIPFDRCVGTRHVSCLVVSCSSCRTVTCSDQWPHSSHHTASHAHLAVYVCSCFSSPHTRARQTADIVWQPWRGVAPEPEPHFLHSLSEVDLGWFQGLRNGACDVGVCLRSCTAAWTLRTLRCTAVRCAATHVCAARHLLHADVVRRGHCAGAPRAVPRVARGAGAL